MLAGRRLIKDIRRAPSEGSLNICKIGLGNWFNRFVVKTRDIDSKRTLLSSAFKSSCERYLRPEFENCKPADPLFALQRTAAWCRRFVLLTPEFGWGGRAHPVVTEGIFRHARSVIGNYYDGLRLGFKIRAKSLKIYRDASSVRVVTVFYNLDEANLVAFDQLLAQHCEQPRMRFEGNLFGHATADIVRITSERIRFFIADVSDLVLIAM
ncbi:hypothetical protein BAB74_04575 [Mycobacteroides abscessus]|nr:hypothetical protein A3N97_04870 [Mycobacteroides abscessus]ANN98097.1 hypothetical protein BAB74_04575 [Mycobacteroides abscessus]